MMILNIQSRVKKLIPLKIRTLWFWNLVGITYKNLYNVDISDGLVSKIVEKITPEITAWQNRPLETVYPFVFMDAIHYKVKGNHQYITKAAYVVLGVQTDEHKNILGVWIGENESTKF